VDQTQKGHEQKVLWSLNFSHHSFSSLRKFVDKFFFYPNFTPISFDWYFVLKKNAEMNIIAVQCAAAIHSPEIPNNTIKQTHS
jgi:hypothetical protein